jgi:predicted RNase H-like nuclease (RuvC/YqgF family)
MRSQARAFESINTSREKLESDQVYSHRDGPSREVNHIRAESHEATKRFRELEKRVKELQRAKEEYEKKCRNLEQENNNLKDTVKDAISQAQSKWTKFDEEQFQKAREARLEDQTLVKKHFRSHLDRINYHYQIKNQWCMTDKPHFEIAIPAHFQRAEDLNIRDKMYEEREAEVLRGQGNYALPKPDGGAQVDIQSKKPKRMTGNSQGNSRPLAFQALKRLTSGS